MSSQSWNACLGSASPSSISSPSDWALASLFCMAAAFLRSCGYGGFELSYALREPCPGSPLLELLSIGRDIPPAHRLHSCNFPARSHHHLLGKVGSGLQEEGQRLLQVHGLLVLVDGCGQRPTPCRLLLRGVGRWLHVEVKGLFQGCLD